MYVPICVALFVFKCVCVKKMEIVCTESRKVTEQNKLRQQEVKGLGNIKINNLAEPCEQSQACCIRVCLCYFTYVLIYLCVSVWK